LAGAGSNGLDISPLVVPPAAEAAGILAVPAGCGAMPGLAWGAVELEAQFANATIPHAKHKDNCCHFLIL
jgi:hypothetical protein